MCVCVSVSVCVHCTEEPKCLMTSIFSDADQLETGPEITIPLNHTK